MLATNPYVLSTQSTEGPRVQIVRFLEDSPDGLSIHYLGYLLNETASEIERLIQPLIDQGVVRLFDGSVALTDEGRESIE